MTPASFRKTDFAPLPTRKKCVSHPSPKPKASCRSIRRAEIARDSFAVRWVRWELLETDDGPAIVAVNNQRRAGTSSFVLLQKRGGQVCAERAGTARQHGLHARELGTELVDADEDGYQELLFSGKDSTESRTLKRLILFVPNEKRTYSMQMTGETISAGTPRIQWLSNAAGADAAPYRTALRQKARSIVAKKR